MRTGFPRIAVLALALAAGGCIMPFNGPGGVRRDVQQVTGRDYDRTFALTIGRSGLALIRWIAREEGEEPLPLEGLRKVEVGVYEVRDSPEAGAPAALTPAVWPGWKPMVEIHPDPGENVLVLSEAGSTGSTERILLVVESAEDLVVVRLSGDLDRFIEQAMRYAFEQARRADLADPSIEEYRRSQETGSAEPLL